MKIVILVINKTFFYRTYSIFKNFHLEVDFPDTIFLVLIDK